MLADPVAAAHSQAHTRSMGVFFNRSFLLAVICGVLLAAIPGSADEIRLKDGKKLYGVIVAYEENMFKVKTDFGYVVVEKDKIPSITPSPRGSPEAKPAPKSVDSAKNSTNAQPKPEAAVASATDSTPSASNASAKASVPSAAKRDKTDKPAGKITSTTVKPELPANAPTGEPAAPALKGSPAAANAALPPTAAQPALTKEPEVPAIREDVQGNLYTNYTHGFRMYKAPSWQLLDDARNALPNAIVAMGTSNESTLMVVGREKTKEPLDSAAVTVEKRLRDIYENYQRDERLRGARKTAVSPVHKPKLAIQVDTFHVEQLHFTRFYLVLRKTFADERNARICSHKALDHPDAGQFHGDVNPRSIRPEQFVEHLPGETGRRKNQRLRGHFLQRQLRPLRQRVSRADHKPQTVPINMVDFQVRRFRRQRNYADVDQAIFHTLQYFMAEIPVNTDVHQRKSPLKLRKNIRQKIQAGCLVGAEHHRTLHHVAAIRNKLHRLIAQPQKILRILAYHFPGRCQLHAFCRAVQQPRVISLLQLPDLRADRGLRAEHL